MLSKTPATCWSKSNSASLHQTQGASIRLITRVAFGFKSADALIALAMLNLGGHRPILPGRR